MSSSAAKANLALIAVALVLPYPVIRIVAYLFSLSLDWLHYFFIELLILALVKENIVLLLAPSVKEIDSALHDTLSPHAEDDTGDVVVEEGDGGKAEVSDEVKKATPTGALPADPKWAELAKTCIEQFMNAANNQNASEWNTCVENEQIKVYQKQGRPNCFKILTTLDNTPLTCFDYISDVNRRQQWDDMAEEARIVEEIDCDTRIVYVRTKAIFPTAGRDIVLFTHRTVLPDGRLLNVTKSVEHPSCPEDPKGKIVRMEGGVAGLICGPSPKGPNKCDVFQLMDGDPKGSIPRSVINYVAKTAVPASTAALNKKLAALPAIDKPKRKSRGPKASPAILALEEELDKLKQSIEALEQARNPANLSPVDQVRRALDYAGPFMLGTVYFITLYQLFAGRRRR